MAAPEAANHQLNWMTGGRVRPGRDKLNKHIQLCVVLHGLNENNFFLPELHYKRARS